jgi:hypothetical protein
LGQLNIRLLKTLLHDVDLSRPILDQVIAESPEISNRLHLGLRAKRASEKPQAVEFLNQGGIKNICLVAFEILHLPWIDHDNLDAVVF